MAGRLTRGRAAPLAAVALAAVALAAGACNDLPDGSVAPTTTLAPGPGAAADAALPPPPVPAGPRGGSVRVVVSGDPDPVAPTLAGAEVRSLVLPQLFTARPDGRWQTSLVVPGSDRTGPGARTATFRILDGAGWSDGTPVTAADLERSADRRFVATVEGSPSGEVRLRFTQALPSWRRLWSGADSVAPPRPGVWGGPFAVASVVPGLETVLVPNPGWRGGGPLLDEVRLTLVPDTTTALQLLEAGRVDVVAPSAYTIRSRQLRTIEGTDTATAAGGGWWTAVVVDGDVERDRRRALLRSVDRRRFVEVLLDGEATRLDGLAGPEDATWTALVTGDPVGLGKVVLTTPEEEPMFALLERVVQKRARAADAEVELRRAEAARVEGWVAAGEYEAALVRLYDGPAVCWSCRYGPVDGALASAADAGDGRAVAALEARLRDEGWVLPLWRPRAAVAWRTGAVAGVRPNGWALSPAWNAREWHRPDRTSGG